MKKLVLILLLISTSFRLIADVGNAYRYKATFILTENREITGYFFFTTYHKEFNKNETDFTNYILTYYNFPIELFTYIKTTVINEYLTIDFVQDSGEIVINKNEIIRIDLFEEIETEVGSRLRIVSEKEFKLLNQDFINFETIFNELYAVNCSFYLLNWNKRNNLKEITNQINNRIKEYKIDNNHSEFLKYIDKMKKDLANKEIILFEYCSPL